MTLPVKAVFAGPLSLDGVSASVLLDFIDKDGVVLDTVKFELPIEQANQPIAGSLHSLNLALLDFINMQRSRIIASHYASVGEVILAMQQGQVQLG